VPHFSDEFEGFFNCGRIIRNELGEIDAIVELKDAHEQHKKVRELNVSYYCFDAKWLWKNIDQLGNDNNAKEFYLTDLIHMAKEQGKTIHSIVIEDPKEGLGINTEKQLEVVVKHLS
jgi:bifunctional UDP-N-acetylglucosamine pyrophosphorylase/glucosamine-1-phosphate N-acetyltransferase